MTKQKKKKKYNYTGKKFEEDFQNSIPNDIFLFRLKDSPSKYSKVKNICDFFLYKRQILYMIELKTTKGKSLPFENIAPHQIELMDKHMTLHEGIFSGFLVNFNELERTFFVNVDDVKQFINSNIYIYYKNNMSDGRKSIPIEWFELNGIEVPSNKKISRYNYDISYLIDVLNQLILIQEQS